MMRRGNCSRGISALRFFHAGMAGSCAARHGAVRRQMRCFTVSRVAVSGRCERTFTVATAQTSVLPSFYLPSHKLYYKDDCIV